MLWGNYFESRDQPKEFVQNMVLGPKGATTWEGTIHITSSNWTNWTTDYPQMFTGFGTAVDPYVLQDVIINANGNNYGIYLQSPGAGVYFRIENCTVFNTSMGYTDAGIYIYNGHNGIVKNSSVYNCSRGISIDTGWNTYISVEENTIYNNTEIGISFNTASHNMIRNNTVFGNKIGIEIASVNSQNNSIIQNYLSNNSWADIDIEYAKNTTIYNNTCLYGKSITSYGSIFVNNGVNATVLNNTISHTDGPGIRAYFAHDSIIEDNAISYSADQGILVQYTNNCMVKYNKVVESLETTFYAGGIAVRDSNFIRILNNSVQAAYNGFWAEWSEYFEIRNNNFTDNSVSGIYMANVNHTTMFENRLADGIGHGMDIRACENLTASYIQANHFEDAGLFLGYDTKNPSIINSNFTENTHGAYFTSVKNATIVWNNFSNNENYGLYIAGSMDNSTLMHNVVNNNVGPGFYLTNSDWNNITFNTANGNGHGIYIFDSNYNNIYNNTFKANDIANIYLSSGAGNNIYDNNLLDVWAYWTANATTIVEGMWVEFNGQGTGDSPLSWFWDFDDFSYAYIEDPEPHYFPTVGEFLVNLTVTDNDGDWDSYTAPITVELDVGVMASSYMCNYSLPIKTGDYVYFYNISDLGGNGQLTYQWYFGDGTANATVRTPIHQFNSVGVFTAIITVKDVDGDIDVYMSVPITVEQDYYPEAEIVVNTTLCLTSEWVFFNMTTLSVVSGNPPLSYEWSFGDSGNTTKVYTTTAYHRYFAAGIYTATLNVTDNDGDTALDSVTITVELDTQPDAYFTYDATHLKAKEIISFTHVNLDGNAPLVFQWSFGDGTGNETTRNPAHEYEQAGNYTVTLTVIDRNGDVDVYSKEIKIEDPEEDEDDDPFDLMDDLVNSPYFYPLMGGMVGFILVLGVIKMFRSGKRSNKQSSLKPNKSEAKNKFPNVDPKDVDWKF